MDGVVRLAALGPVPARGVIVTVRGEERWRYEATTVGADGTRHTERRTGTADLPPEPAPASGPLSLAAGWSEPILAASAFPNFGVAWPDRRSMPATMVV